LLFRVPRNRSSEREDERPEVADGGTRKKLPVHDSVVIPIADVRSQNKKADRKVLISLPRSDSCFPAAVYAHFHSSAQPEIIAHRRGGMTFSANAVRAPVNDAEQRLPGLVWSMP